MNGAVAAALLAMGMSANRDQAQHWARVASSRGASPVEMAEAWARWDRLENAGVTVILADVPRPCPHGCAGGHTEDEYDGGGCPHRVVEAFEGWGPGR